MSTIKTLTQERARFCLICVRRIKLLKEGKWQELQEDGIKDFLPQNFSDFEVFKNFEGAKKEAYKSFEKERKKDENRNRQNEEIYNDFKKKEFVNFDYSKDYSSHAKGLPQMIISNGLISTLAFYKAKEKDRGQIYQDISEILEALNFKPYCEEKKKNSNLGLLDFLLNTDVHILRLATNEVISIANWLKRMTEVEL
ncbi:MAG: type III-B CRISPR module-associated protein Cmr5 [Candidatus Omnitrophica bacterium]|nr:type III-B CRISPR module-associated protein Cmr5 [Candidatus Omnitrophota bacterium]